MAEPLGVDPLGAEHAAAAVIAAGKGGGGGAAAASAAMAARVGVEGIPANITYDQNPAPDCGGAWEHFEIPSRRKRGKIYPQVSRVRGDNKQTFRFFIFVGGPPGSGKSTIALKLQKIATSINASAAGFVDRSGQRVSRDFIKEATPEVYKTHGWVVLGHDQEICENSDKKKKLCKELLAWNNKHQPTGDDSSDVGAHKGEKSPHVEWAISKVKHDQEAYNRIRTGSPQSLSSTEKLWRRKCADHWFTHGTPCPPPSAPPPPPAAMAAATASPQMQWGEDIKKFTQYDAWKMVKKEEATVAAAAAAAAAGKQGRAAEEVTKNTAELEPWVLSSLAAIDYWGTDERHGGLPFIRPPKSHSAMSWTAIPIHEKGDLCRKTEGEVDAWGRPTLAAIAEEEAADTAPPLAPPSIQAAPAEEETGEGIHIEPPRCTVRKYFEQQDLSGTDMLLYTKIPYMIHNGVNIVYETTFQNMDTIQFICEQIARQTNDCKSFQYIIMLGFPIVNIAALQRRIWCREETSRKPEGRQKDPEDCYRGLQGLQFEHLAESMTKSYTNLISFIDACGRDQPEGSGIWGCKGVGIDLLYIYDNNKVDEMPWMQMRLSKRSYKIQSKRGVAEARANPIGPKDQKKVIEKIQECLTCIGAVRKDRGGDILKQTTSVCGGPCLPCVSCESTPAEKISDELPSCARENPLADWDGRYDAGAGLEGEEGDGREASPDPNAFADSQDSIFGEEEEEDAATDIKRVYRGFAERRKQQQQQRAAANIQQTFRGFAARKKKKTAETNPGGGGGRRTRKYRKKSKRRTRRR